jgi:hypothetical protein
VKAGLSKRVDRAISAAASLGGKRFALLVASSLVATSAIVAGAMTGTGSDGALAALLGRKLPVSAQASAAPANPVAEGAAASTSTAPTRASAGEPAPAPAAAPGSTLPPPAAREPASKPAPEAPTPEPGRVGHVFEISLASPGYEAAFGAESQIPYLAGTLRPRGELLSGYSLLSETALPNGVAAISGQPPNSLTEADCPAYDEFKAGTAPDAKGVVSGAGCAYPVEALTVADQLGSARLSWRAYVDGMVDESGQPQSCVHPDPGVAPEPVPGGYSATQNPFVYFHSLLDLGDCATNDLSIASLSADLRKADSTPNFVYIAATPCHAGVPGQCPEGVPEGPGAANAFLEEWVPQILASPAFKKDGVLIVGFGSGAPAAVDPASGAPPAAGAAPPSATVDPLRVGALLVSQFAAPGSSDATSYDPYSLLRTVEDLFRLEHLAVAGRAKTRSFAAGLLGESGGD